MSRVLASVAAAALSVVAALPSLAAQEAKPVTRPRTAAEDLQLFSQVFNQIRLNHPDSMDSHRLFMAAIQAMVQATDPHSYVIPSVRLEAGKEEQLRQGRLHPVPIEFAFVGGSAIVSNVAAGTDARRRDILPGDELVAIDGEPMQAESPLELDITLSGPRNSRVVLTLERRDADGSYRRFDREVKRERFGEETAVPAAVMLDDSTGYVRITTFVGEKVAADLRAAVQRLERTGMKRLVMDLRGNGGGSVDEAATIAGEFLPTGAVVYTSEGRRQSAVDTGRVKRSFWRSERQYPMLVMIDDGTASASELVAGALQDHDRALIVGQSSFGKSLMMRGFPLSDGSVLVLVIGQVRTPCGRAVQRDYRGTTSRNYYRLASVERDTVGRPSCKTAGGRTVYGGGGIFPDVRTTRPPAAPAWVRRINEMDLATVWAGTYVSTNAASLANLEQFAAKPTLAADALSGFRGLAQERGATVPDGEEADKVLTRLLLQAVAFAKWGNPGLYQVEARIDPDIGDALRHFDKAPSAAK